MMTGLGLLLLLRLVHLPSSPIPLPWPSAPSAIPVITLAGITGLPLAALSAQVGRICAPISLFIPAYLILVTSGWAALVEIWPAVVVTRSPPSPASSFSSRTTSAHSSPTSSPRSPPSADSSLLLRFWTPQKRSPLQSRRWTPRVRHHQALPAPPGTYTTREIWAAWMPYGLLVIFVLAWGLPAHRPCSSTRRLSPSPGPACTTRSFARRPSSPRPPNTRPSSISTSFPPPAPPACSPRSSPPSLPACRCPPSS